jgi:hypothetical protein
MANTRPPDRFELLRSNDDIASGSLMPNSLPMKANTIAIDPAMMNIAPILVLT